MIIIFLKLFLHLGSQIFWYFYFDPKIFLFFALWPSYFSFRTINFLYLQKCPNNLQQNSFWIKLTIFLAVLWMSWRTWRTTQTLPMTLLPILLKKARLLSQLGGTRTQHKQAFLLYIILKPFLLAQYHCFACFLFFTILFY